MKYIFHPDTKGIICRISDGMRGMLSEYPDIVNIQPDSAMVDPDDFEVYVEPIYDMQVEEIAAVQLQAAYDAAGNIFNSMSLGKQALWEPVRLAVGAAILEGNMLKAYDIIITTPIIYLGAEDDRDMFLNLFQ